MERDNHGKFSKGHTSLRLKNKNKCKVTFCLKEQLVKGFCGLHYQRNRMYGNPEHPLQFGKHLKNGKNIICIQCGKEKYKRPSDIKKNSTGNLFCSRYCAYKFWKGKSKTEKPMEQSKWRINKKGYLETTRKRKRIYQHRWVVETQIIKRALKNEEIIHHLNGIKIDNRPENLAVCCNKTHHLFIKKLRERIKELEDKLYSMTQRA